MTGMQQDNGSFSSVALRHEAARIQLARISVARDRPLRNAVRALAAIVAETVDVARLSIWLLSADNRSIRCEFLYQPHTRDVFEGSVLYAQDFPNYFRAMSARRVIAVTDVRNDVIVEEFRAAYFDPLGITSMLDAPIYANGRIAGIVCHEHIGEPRQWTTADCEFAANVADIIARLHVESQRLQAESTLGSVQSHVMELQRAGTMGRLAAGMAHDFRNLLGAVTGYAELMASTAPDNEKLQGYSRELLHAVEHGTELTQELLTLSQELPCRPVVADLEQVLLNYRSLLAMAAGGRVALEMDLAHDLCRVFIDPAQIERAVLNLVVNARDAMPDKGSVLIRLYTAAPHADEGQHVVIEVADTGCGMDISTQELMFEPFFTTKGDSGTGLGLAIVQQIIHHAGGHIEVDSKPGEGTRIRLYLPGISSHS